jgi:hypothetical protein
VEALVVKKSSYVVSRDISSNLANPTDFVEIVKGLCASALKYMVVVTRAIFKTLASSSVPSM